MTFTAQDQKEFLKRGFTRRNLGKIAAMITAGTTLPFYNEIALAQASKIENAPPDAVMINANENPMGPSEEARNAVHAIVAQGGRYLFGETDKVQKILAEQEGLKTESIRIYPGSSAPLHQSVLAFTSPTKPLVMGNPGYEAGALAAKFIGAKVVRVPLTSDYRHDVKAMLAQGGPNAGLFYICNPNNPTGTLTPKAEIEWLVANKPKGSVVMIDEAYTHISEAPFNSDLVAKDKDVIVLRTFSKNLRHGGIARRCSFGPARSDRQTRRIQRRNAADHGHGCREYKPAAEESDSGAAQGNCGRPRADFQLPREEQIPLRTFRLELLHGGRETACRRSCTRDAQGKGLHRPRVACMAHLRPCHGGYFGRDEEVPGRLPEGDGLTRT